MQINAQSNLEPPLSPASLNIRSYRRTYCVATNKSNNKTIMFNYAEWNADSDTWLLWIEQMSRPTWRSLTWMRRDRKHLHSIKYDCLLITRQRPVRSRPNFQSAQGGVKVQKWRWGGGQKFHIFCRHRVRQGTGQAYRHTHRLAYTLCKSRLGSLSLGGVSADCWRAGMNEARSADKEPNP